MKKTLLLLFSLSWAILLSGQQLSPELVSSSGAFKDTLGISLSWSVGEVVSDYFSRSENQLSQGFHHGKYVITTIITEQELEYDIKVYPNPVKDLINISFANMADITSKKFHLFDIKGNLLKTGRINNTIETIDLSHLSPAIYLLRITEKNRNIKTFRIKKER